MHTNPCCITQNRGADLPQKDHSRNETHLRLNKPLERLRNRDEVLRTKPLADFASYCLSDCFCPKLELNTVT